VSDKAADITGALRRYVKDGGAQVICAEVNGVSKTPETGFKVTLSSGEEYRSQRVIMATGGVSYPGTGSTGDGYRFARTLGHTVVPPKASIVPIISKDTVCRRLMGLSLRNCGFKIIDASNKTVFSDFGEMLFTHFGVSGPLVLSASAHIKDAIPGKYRIELDLKPAVSEEQLERRLLRDFESQPNKNIATLVAQYLPGKMVGVFLSRCHMELAAKIHSITKEQRNTMISLLKHFSFSADGLRPVAEAIVTSGGIALSEVDPSTMGSKLIPGLFFAGEVLDIDAYTGGFNLQIALSTGRSAGKGISKR
jgi:predicted Rossmann fold flavoprotein